MSDEYTPTMAEIRAEYAKGASEEIALYQSSIFGDHPYKPGKGERVTHYLSKQIIPGERANAHAEFDRMIAEVERAAAEQAWDRCVASSIYADGSPVEIVANVNPYRKD